MTVISRRTVSVVVGVFLAGVCLAVGGCGLGREERVQEYELNDLENAFEAMDGVVDADVLRTEDRFGSPASYDADIWTRGLTQDERVALVTEAYRIYWQDTDYPIDRILHFVVMDRDDPRLDANGADGGIGDDDASGVDGYDVGATDLEDVFGPRP